MELEFMTLNISLKKADRSSSIKGSSMSDSHLTNSPLATELDAGAHYVCTCGKSSKFPFCDGAHKGSGMAPYKLELTAKKAVHICRCGKTAGMPMCDGSHKK